MLYGDNFDPNNPTPNISAIMQSSNLYAYGQSNPITYIDLNGQSTLVTCIIIGAIAGAIIGAVTAAVLSYNKYNEIKWKNVAIGFTVGGVIGASVGALVSAIGLTSTGAISTGLYKTIDEGVNFSKAALNHMTESFRFVPVQSLIEAIKYGTSNPDPQGSKAIMYTVEMVRNGTAYTLEVLYDEVSNTIYHFLYK
jgi:hypothetical protein